MEERTIKNLHITAIIPAAGNGTRLKGELSKQFLNLGNKPILVHTLEKFEKSPLITDIVLVTKDAYMAHCKKEIVEKYQFKKVSNIILGGKERQHSVYEGLQSLPSSTDIVLVHDAVRPFVHVGDIEKTIQEAIQSKACALGVKSKDTIKICGDNNVVVQTPKRDNVWQIQTPQAFAYGLLLEAYHKAARDNFLGTDDATLVERLGHPLKIVEGSYDNIKITTADDLIIGNKLIQ